MKSLHVWISINLAIISLIYGSPVFAETIYVATTGNDSNPGTEVAPLRTLQAAVNKIVELGPLTDVRVREGDYQGFNYGWDGEPGGTAEDPIKFSADAGVRITEDNPDTPDGINIENVSYVVVEGFEVIGATRTGIRVAGGHHITIRENTCRDNGKWGILTGFTDDLLIENNITSGSILEHGIYVGNSPKRPVIRGNISYSNHGGGIQINADRHAGDDGICEEALIENNILYENGRGGGSAINLDGVVNSTIRNNLLYDNHASGISLFRQDGTLPSSNNMIVNNTIIQASDGRWALNIQNESTDTKIFNNILITGHSFRGSLSICTSCISGTESDNNLLNNRITTDGSEIISLARWQTQTGHDLNSLAISVSDSTYQQLFWNYHARDLRLKENSAAIDRGNDSCAPDMDIQGRSRPVGDASDIGAFEFDVEDSVGPLPTPAPSPDDNADLKSPSNLQGAVIKRGKKILLSWEDNTENERGFILQRAIGSEKFRKFLRIRKNRTRARINLSKRARKEGFHFRIQAYRGKRKKRILSDFSNIFSGT